ncbi:LysR family transcriptional regulator [Neorhizobium galegae]|uniref:LysR family transcriptional regulator n=1 Tax=Neorhizobium galegae TaxID=399 RepID=UPI0006211A4B|nr:LysR family transcriptional regulator [Neorhizobium galegae]CDZ30731.1 StmR [Neorhizobium galegae bv. officinalis]MCQ1769172.1 LysR family transcriptional regulator [Neorhizobium galegae]MCQ1775723.1 LysR family transcriptional regulator [Neorhizobium galegae]MCQ1797135.1 LysR family transcriptional regulator [Neorhizobium galegae]MCQ1846337.1 LysR family transcriptional regulator [Neorhizobium galegae]
MNKNLHRLDLRQLRHFLAVVHTGSFSMAAENLRLTQPALSKSIRSMEQALGVRLLDRGPTGIQVTLFGEKLLGYSELLLSLADEAVHEIDSLRGARSGSLRIGSMAAALRQLVPDALNQFAVARPDVSVLVHEGVNEVLLPQLFSGKLDVVFTVKQSDLLNEDFEWRLVAREPVSIVAHQSHPLANRKNVTAADLAEFSWVLPPLPESDRLILEAFFKNASLPKPVVAIETTSINFLTSMIARTSHLAYLTRANLEGSGLGLVPLDFHEISLTRDIYAVFRRKGEVRPTVSVLLKEISRYGDFG